MWKNSLWKSYGFVPGQSSARRSCSNSRNNTTGCRGRISSNIARERDLNSILRQANVQTQRLSGKEKLFRPFVQNQTSICLTKAIEVTEIVSVPITQLLPAGIHKDIRSAALAVATKSARNKQTNATLIFAMERENSDSKKKKKDKVVVNTTPRRRSNNCVECILYEVCWDNKPWWEVYRWTFEPRHEEKWCTANNCNQKNRPTYQSIKQQKTVK